MTLQQETLRLGDERERLDAKLDELVDQAAGADDATAVQTVATRVQTRAAAVDWLVEEYGPDATVTVRGLDAGEYANAEDDVAGMRQQASQDSVPGAKRNVFAAHALVDAPFLEKRDPPFEEAIETLADQPPGVVKWVHNRADSLTTVSGEDFRTFSERLAARQSEGE